MVTIKICGLKRPIFLILVGVFLLPGLLKAQQAKQQEGSDQPRKYNEADTVRIRSLLKQSEDFRSINPDSSILFAQRAVELSGDVSYDYGKAEGFKYIGNINFDRGNLQNALDYYNRALKVYETMADTSGISNLQSNLGSVYANLGDNPKALDFFIKSLRNAQSLSDTLRIGTAYMNLGTVYQDDASTRQQAIESYQLAIDMFKKIDYKLGVAGTSLNFGQWYVDQDKPNEAIPYLQDALVGFKELGFYEAYTLNALGQAYFDLGRYQVAEGYYQQALAQAAEKPNLGEESKTYLGLADIYRKQNDNARAIESYRKGLDLAMQTGVLEDQGEAYSGLSESYAALADFKSAFDAQQEYTLIQDQLKSENYQAEMSKLRVQFDLENAEQEIDLLNTRNTLNELQIEEDARAKRSLTIILFLFLAIIAGFVFQYFYIKRTNKRLAFERNRSDQILLNILPEEVAEELKQKGFTEAKEFDDITVMFTDFKGFSLVAERVSAEKLVKSVDYYFKHFDEVIERHNLEKIKTIGDAYMCAGGLPTPNQTHARDAFEAALEILQFVKETELNPPKDIYPFQIRIGLSSGPVVAGVVGTKKFAYDIWGNTVNIAARMESGSVPGRINVSQNIYEELKGDYEFTYRGELQVKSQTFKMYFAEIPEEVPV